MGFPGQEYWSGLPFPSPGDLPDPGFKLTSLALAGRFFTTEPPGKPNTGFRRDKLQKNRYKWLIKINLWIYLINHSGENLNPVIVLNEVSA